MKNKPSVTIEDALFRCLNQSPGLDFDKLAAMPVVKMAEHDWITKQAAQTPKKSWRRQGYIKPISAVVACFMVMMVCLTAWVTEFKIADSIIALDANQSIEIVTNKQRQILSVKSFDQKVQTVLDEKNWSQVKLEESVGVILTSMIKNGNLDEGNNVLMVSVENRNNQKAKDLAASLDHVINKEAADQNKTTTVVKQFVTPDKASGATAEGLNISTGKFNVIQEIISKDPTMTMDHLAAMSMTNLLEISEQKAVDLSAIIEEDDQQPAKDIKKESGQVDPQPNADIVVEDSTLEQATTTKDEDQSCSDDPAEETTTTKDDNPDDNPVSSDDQAEEATTTKDDNPDDNPVSSDDQAEQASPRGPEANESAANETLPPAEATTETEGVKLKNK